MSSPAPWSAPIHTSTPLTRSEPTPRDGTGPPARTAAAIALFIGLFFGLFCGERSSFLNRPAALFITRSCAAAAPTERSASASDSSANSAEAPPPPPEVQADGAEVWRLDGADEPYTPEAPYTPPGALPPPGLSVDEAIAWYQSAPPPAPYATFAVPALPSRRGASPPPRPATAAPAGRDSTSLGSRVAADAMRWRRPGTAAASMLQHGHLVDAAAAADPSAPRPQTAAGKAPYGLDAVPDGAVSWHGIPPCRPATAEPTTAAARRRRAPLAPPYATAPADEVENVPPKTAASPSDVLRLAAAAGSRIRLDDEHPSMMPWASSWMDQSKRPSSRRVRALPRGSQIPWG